MKLSTRSNASTAAETYRRKYWSSGSSVVVGDRATSFAATAAARCFGAALIVMNSSAGELGDGATRSAAAMRRSPIGGSTSAVNALADTSTRVCSAVAPSPACRSWSATSIAATQPPPVQEVWAYHSRSQAARAWSLAATSSRRAPRADRSLRNAVRSGTQARRPRSGASRVARQPRTRQPPVSGRPARR